MTEKKIQDALFNKFAYGPYVYHLCNTYIFRHDWESDFYFQSKSGVHIEVEIKISRGDFKKDLQKIRKHQILDRVTNKGVQLIPFPSKRILKLKAPENNEHWETMELRGQSEWIYWFDIKKNPIPNKFYYAAPSGLLEIEEIPNYAGFIEVNESGQATIVKKAPIIHNNKYDITKTVLSKYYWKYVNARFNIEIGELDNKVAASESQEIKHD